MAGDTNGVLFFCLCVGISVVGLFFAHHQSASRVAFENQQTAAINDLLSRPAPEPYDDTKTMQRLDGLTQTVIALQNAPVQKVEQMSPYAAGAYCVAENNDDKIVLMCKRFS